MRYALIQDSTVVNVIDADGPIADAIPSDTANIGDTWDGEKFTTPPASPTEQPSGETPQKLERTLLVSRIKVTTSSGKTFDGDETSQTRMARAIIALQATGTPTTPWVLADNSAVSVSAVELAEALALAGAAQTALWVL